MTLTNLEIAALKRAEQTSQRSDATHLALLLSGVARELRANDVTPARLRQLGARCFLFSRVLENEPQPSLIARPKKGIGHFEILNPERQTDGSYRGRYRYVWEKVYNELGPGLFPADAYDFEPINCNAVSSSAANLCNRPVLLNAHPRPGVATCALLPGHDGPCQP